MEVFSRVVQTGTFTRAAESLRLPKATATTLVRNLEMHLGVRLLNRTTRRVSVTADGRAYYDRCIRILADVAETEGALAPDAAAPRGRLRADVPGALGRLVIVPALLDFFARYPGIRLELGCTDRPVDLVEEGVDCVLRGGTLTDASLVARRVATFGFVFCAAPEYLARRGTPLHPEELRRHACVNYFSPRTGAIFEWDFARDDERLKLTLDGDIAVNDGDAYLAAGLAGMGIMLSPEPMVRDALAAGRLTRVLADWTSEPLSLYFMYPQSRHLSPRVRVFGDWLGALFERLGWAPETGVVDRVPAGDPHYRIEPLPA